MKINLIKCDNCGREIHSEIGDRKDDFFTLYHINGNFMANNARQEIDFDCCSFVCMTNLLASYFVSSPVKKDLIEILNKIIKENNFEGVISDSRKHDNEEDLQKSR